MTREVVGTVECDRHLGPPMSAEVRVNIKKKLYLCCPLCGLDQAVGLPRQDWIRANYRPVWGDDETELTEKPEKKKKGFFDL